MRSRRLIAALALVAMASVACSAGPDPFADQDADQLSIGVPPTLAGLSVKLAKKPTEQLLTEAQGSDSYLRDGVVFELRHGKELRAVYQVVRLTPDARADDPEFRRTVAASIGGSQAPANIGGVAVYETRRVDQIINTWFEGQFMQVLIVRDTETIVGQDPGFEYPQLLAEVLALEPAPLDA